MVQFCLSPAASQRIAEIIAAQNQDNQDQTDQGRDNDGQEAPLALRVSVLSGGCNGFQYQFKLDRNRHKDDKLITQDDALVVVDTTSLELLEGAELDYVDKLMGAHFTIKNPNAASSCGCGNSFSLD